MKNVAPNRHLLHLLLLAAVGGAVWHLPRSGAFRLAHAPHPTTPITDENLVEMRPREEPGHGFVGSTACVECHRNQHRSWSNSWHRTMTQVTTTNNFIGSLDGVISAEGVRYGFAERGGRPWVHIDNPPPRFNPVAVDRRDYPIVMTTGSHFMQLGWFPAGHTDTLGLLPLAYLKADQRWVPHSTIFLQPPEARSSTRVGIWNEGCIRCHTTGPETRRGQGSNFERVYGHETRVAEFGISCEACHGPGEEHVHLRRQAGDAAIADDPIVNPAHLNHELASEICGACHADADPRPDFRDTPFHLPGHPLNERYHVKPPPAAQTEPTGGADSYHDDGTTMYWADGMARVSGTEFSALRASRCYTAGEISCLSCHSLHQSRNDERSATEWANDMLRQDALRDEACLRCHVATTYSDRVHTIHPPASPGSRCYNCHMPHTSYGLLKAIRSHAVTSPSVRETLETGRLNACNLCHLDKSLGWTARSLQQHYALPTTNQLAALERELSAAVVQALTGDAGQRALVAWAMSWPPAVAASNGEDWIPPHLANLLGDPYSAVRYIAGKSLKRFPDYAQLDYDYIAEPAKLSRDATALIAKWRSTDAHPHALISPDGTIDQHRFQQLRQRRNDEDIALLE